MSERERGEKEIGQHAVTTPDDSRTAIVSAHITKTAFQATLSGEYIPNGLAEVLVTLGPVEKSLGEAAVNFYPPFEMLLSGETTLLSDATSLCPDDDEEEAWQERALCAQVGTDVFFPEKGESTRPAKQICSLCDVRADCLDYALKNSERFGVWGGLSERERRSLKKRQG